MAIDYAALAAVGGIPKGRPRILDKHAKDTAEDRAWQQCCDQVDARDQRRCQVTDACLSARAVDPWLALERHHLEPRSKAKLRRFNPHNVWTISAAVHQLIGAGALRVLNKHGRRATSVETIDYLEWNRRMVARGEEPCRIRKGLAVRA